MDTCKTLVNYISILYKSFFVLYSVAHPPIIKMIRAFFQSYTSSIQSSVINLRIWIPLLQPVLQS